VDLGGSDPAIGFNYLGRLSAAGIEVGPVMGGGSRKHGVS